MAKEDEMILVVPTKTAVPQTWTGLKPAESTVVEKLIRQHGTFKRRGDMEDDPSWKQIIPYMIFGYQDKFFLMQRSDQGGETRLHNKYSLGIGGHINAKDIQDRDINEWGKREFAEEIDYRGRYQIKSLGLLNHDIDPVGQVHLGYVLLLTGISPNIRIRDEHQSGQLATIEEIKSIYDQMETWSQLTFDFLNKHND